MINLGRTREDLGYSGPMTADDADEKGMIYPEVYIEGAPKELMRMPKKGKITLDYELCGKSESTDEDGKVRNSITLRFTGANPPSKSSNPMDELDQEEADMKEKESPNEDMGETEE